MSCRACVFEGVDVDVRARVFDFRFSDAKLCIDVVRIEVEKLVGH